MIVLDYRGLLDINMEQVVAECKSLRDKLARDTRLKVKLMQALKRNELQLKQARDSLANTQQQHERTQAQVTQNSSSFLYPHLDADAIFTHSPKKNAIIKKSHCISVFQIFQDLATFM